MAPAREAVLPPYVSGLVVAGVFLHDRVVMDRLRSIAFALLTPAAGPPGTGWVRA